MMPDPEPTQAWLQEQLLAGTRWAETGDDLRTGCSCYGLVRAAYRHAGVMLPSEPSEAQELFVRGDGPLQPWDVLQVDFAGIALAPIHLAFLLTLPYGYHCSKAAMGLARFDSRGRFWRRVTKHVWRLALCA